AGRIVVPKPLRLALGLKPGQPLEIRAAEGRLEIAAAATKVQLKKRGKGVVAIPDNKLPVLTADVVRETQERTRRRKPPTRVRSSRHLPRGTRTITPHGASSTLGCASSSFARSRPIRCSRVCPLLTVRRVMSYANFCGPAFRSHICD